MKQVVSRRRYRRRTGGLCSCCRENPHPERRRTCKRCHALYMQHWRLKQKPMLTEEERSRMIELAVTIIRLQARAEGI